MMKVYRLVVEIVRLCCVLWCDPRVGRKFSALIMMITKAERHTMASLIVLSTYFKFPVLLLRSQSNCWVIENGRRWEALFGIPKLDRAFIITVFLFKWMPMVNCR